MRPTAGARAAPCRQLLLRRRQSSRRDRWAGIGWWIALSTSACWSRCASTVLCVHVLVHLLYPCPASLRCPLAAGCSQHNTGAAACREQSSPAGTAAAVLLRPHCCARCAHAWSLPPHPTAQAVRSLGFGEVAEQLERASGISSQPCQVRTACCAVRGSLIRCLAAAFGRSPIRPQPERLPRAPLCSTHLLARCAALSAG